MQKFLLLVFLYCFGCVMGWVLELFYRRFAPNNKERKWYNPGFLVGPYLPLYGFGLTLLYLISLTDKYIEIKNIYIDKALIVVAIAVAMTLIELIAGKIFIVGMNVKLWDYSNEWGNYQGIICPKFSFYWTLIGALYYFVLHARVVAAVEWFYRNITFSFVLGMFFGIQLVDVVYSANLLAKVKSFAKSHNIIVRYEELRRGIGAYNVAAKQKVHWLCSFVSDVPLTEHLARYAEAQVNHVKKFADLQIAFALNGAQNITRKVAEVVSGNAEEKSEE